MNAIFFATKRAFHGTLRILRRPLQSFGLTAARFDLMYALMSCPQARRDDGRTQSDLREQLGVSASVVSRMLRSLEAMGMVRRKWDEDDGRQKLVRLSKRGLAAVRAAYQSLRRAAQRLVDEALGGEGGHRDRTQRFWNMLNLDDYLLSLRDSFGDTARQPYYWGHPDD